MIGKIFWMGVGAGAGLWGRQRTLDAVDKRVPASVQRQVKRLAVDRVKRFTQDVKDAERRKTLERELADLRAREEQRKSAKPTD